MFINLTDKCFVYVNHDSINVLFMLIMIRLMVFVYVNHDSINIVFVLIMLQ